MDKKKIFEGKDLEEALHQAAASLGIAEPDLDYEIIEQGRRGLFGIGAKSVRIRVMPPISPLEPQALELLGVQPAGARRRGRGRRSGRDGGDGVADGNRVDGNRVDGNRVDGNRVEGAREPREGGRARPPRRRGRKGGPREPREPRAKAPAEPRPPVPEEELAKIAGTLQQMVDLMGLQLKAEAVSSDSGVDVELAGSDEELLNDRDSELASSLQFILNRMARRTWPDVGRIRLGGDNDRSSGRDDEVIELVKEVAGQVLQTGETKRLHPMNAYERRLVHLTIRKTQGLGSKSEGDGAMKKVSIFKQDKKRSGRSRSRRGRGRKRADG